jgi:hypothetical protein
MNEICYEKVGSPEAALLAAEHLVMAECRRLVLVGQPLIDHAANCCWPMCCGHSPSLIVGNPPLLASHTVATRCTSPEVAGAGLRRAPPGAGVCAQPQRNRQDGQVHQGDGPERGETDTFHAG